MSDWRNIWMRVIWTFLITCLVVETEAQEKLEEQEEKPVYFEQVDSGLTQFYFDEHYFLVDKFCQFKTIERVGKYNLELKSFDGKFIDYNNEGEVVLTGNYANGKKNGVFTSYFANGQINWVTTFKDGEPEGISTYNYPDGLPMMEVLYKDGQVYVQNFWDTRRRQRVTDGNGKYAFAVKAEGYNEYGYEYIRYQGNIKRGKPDGHWDFFLVYEKNESYYAGYEKFKEGKFTAGYDEIKGEPYFKNSKLQVGPSIFFVQAENMMSKKCSIDENQDFSLFLINRLDASFAHYDASSVETGLIEVQAEIDKSGSLKDLEVIKGFPEEDIDALLLKAIKSVEYWIPSYADGEYIDDNFLITSDVMVDTESKQMKFYNLKITRENGT
ncbi:hypothetical protein H8S90_07000 [Olivibacter sp. SDN3]|uniref:toxin-antitoxin system YwqK family antitoxin n=1 Tax=Olivibacter sp. SDN3 TaxID=2764720 RepID=UPI0016516DB1|nr:hypothetical protein [Olivibacter sp. SDN3]QNL51316.1 hypothetical protein H8S90_07000 [Olivibacter sp. SDN3]